MVTYPITINRDYYRGKDSNKQAKASRHNEYASKLEYKLNQVLLKQTAPIKTYFWHEVAEITGIPLEVVSSLGLSIDGGSGGFTAWRHDMTQDQAICAVKSTNDIPDK